MNNTSTIRSFLFLSCLAASGFAQVVPPAPSPDPEAVNLGKIVRLYRITEKKAPRNRGSCGVHIAAVLFDALGTQSFDTAYPRIKRDLDPDTTGIEPKLLVKEFKEHGLEAQTIVNATPAALRERIDAGFPAAAVVQTKAEDPTTHWVLVAGYATDEFDEVWQWYVDDNGVASGSYSNAEFMKLWSIPSYDSKNIYIHIEPGLSFPDELPGVATKLFTNQTQLEKPQLEPQPLPPVAAVQQQKLEKPEPYPPVVAIQQHKREHKSPWPPELLKQQKKPVQTRLEKFKRLAKQLRKDLEQLTSWNR